MIGNNKILHGITWTWIAVYFHVIDAFSPNPSFLFQSQFQSPSSSSSLSPSSFRLCSSSADDDELSKLIGKRNQIKRRKKEELSNEDELFESLTGSSGTVDISDEDFENMPQFQAKRPVLQPNRKETDKEKEDEGRLMESDYIDFFADYDDENDLHIPQRLGISTRCWGEEKEGFVPSGKLKKQQLRSGKFVPGDLQMAYNNLLEKGVLLFDTSPSYGKGMEKMELSGEDILARCIKEYKESNASPLVVNTFPNQLWQRTSNSLTSSLTASCEKMDVADVEVYQTKNIGWLPSGGIIKGMADVVLEQGISNYVGVVNVSPLRMRRLNNKLEKLELSLTTNTFEFSLTNRKKEKWINACKMLGVIPLIKNPLGSGLASGQYTATNPSGGLVSNDAKPFSFKTLEKYQPLHSVLESVAERVRTRVIRESRDVQDKKLGRKGKPPKLNTDITTTQVALNYIVAKGGVPLMEVNNPKQANEVMGCIGWVLNDDEVSMLESATDLCS